MSAPASLPPRAPASLAREDGRQAFGAGAAGYHSIRSPYPAALFAHLAARAGTIDSVLEIGPGSGLATESLLALGPARYVGVESDPGFVAFLRRRFPHSGVELVCAPFPSADLAGPFDLAVCAAAFHWLEPDAALAAVRETLRADGLWAMWWHSYLDETAENPFGQAAMALMRARGVRFPPSFGTSEHIAHDKAGQTALLERNGFRAVEQRRWHEDRQLGPDAARALFESFSFVRLLDDAPRSALLAEIAEIVDRRFGGAAPNRVATVCYSAKPA